MVNPAWGFVDLPDLGDFQHFLAMNLCVGIAFMLRSVESFANDGGLLPEQIWDGADLPERELWKEQPSGPAMPLVWDHAETLELARSIHKGAVFDLPSRPAERYRNPSNLCNRRVWRSNDKLRSVAVGVRLRFECREPAIVHWSTDAWHTTRDDATREVSLGIHYADLPTEDLAPSSCLEFTFH
jgi:glucoamylase